MRIAVRAYAKINWSLSITGRRADGYHELSMFMQTIALRDDLFLETAEELTLTIDGDAPAGGDNLVLRAARALGGVAPGRGARMRLTKRIPARAGLGGGSADGAAALLGLNRLWGLNLSPEALREIGLGLGADLPFCLTGGLARVEGVGERITKLSAQKSLPLVILHPKPGLSTPDVYAAWDAMGAGYRAPDAQRLSALLQSGDAAALRGVCENALEEPARTLLPGIGQAVSRLYDCGAAFAQMTGSGSAVFGVFASEKAAREAAAALGDDAILTRTLIRPRAV